MNELKTKAFLKHASGSKGVGYRGIGVQGYRGTGVQGYKGIEVQGYRGTRV